MKWKNLHTSLTPFTKINSNYTTGLNVKCKTIKLLKDKIGENLDDLEFGDDFLDAIPKAWSIKKELISWTSLNFKISTLWKCQEKEKQATDCEKILAEDRSEKGLFSKI